MALHTFDLEIDPTISPLDTMIVPGREKQYFELGERALEWVEHAARLCHKPHFPRILDYGASYARALRWLRPQHHYAEIVASDIEQEAIQFCARHWGATPHLSDVDPTKVSFDQPFDLIWCGSVFTHLSLKRWRETLDLLIRHTNECGMLVLTFQGRFFASALARKQPYIADDIDQAALLADLKRDGFAYQPYFDSEDQEYGIAVHSPEWLMRELNQRDDIIVRGYIEEAWGMQDIAILYKADKYFEAVV